MWGWGGGSQVRPYVTPGRSERRSSTAVAPLRTNARLEMGFTNAASQLLLPGNSSQGGLNDEGSALVTAEVNPLAASSTASWGDDPALRAMYRCCPRCCVLTAREFDACHRCHASFESMITSASAREIEALQNVSQDSSYGRRLLFVQHRSQVEEAGVAARPGTAAYAAEVFQTVTDASRSTSTRLLLEDKPDDGVIKLDGWLALTDGDAGGARLWNREDVRKFVQREDVEALCVEYIMAHARKIMVDGELVQVSWGPSLMCGCGGAGHLWRW